MLEREDRELANAVNGGLLIMKLSNSILKAATFMALHKVPIEIAQRVLLTRMCRKTDNSPS
jgi:hypothetical protein